MTISHERMINKKKRDIMVYIRFWRRIRLLPKVFLNVSKTGISLTVASRVLNITFGRKGIRFTTGLRGTGLSFTEYKKYKDKYYGKSKKG